MLEEVDFWMSMDAITDLIFGQSFEMLKKPDMRLGGTAITKGFRHWNLCFQRSAFFRPAIGSWLEFETWLHHAVLQMVQTFLVMGTRSALRRIRESQDRKTNEGRKDISSRLINTTDPETGTTFDTQCIVLEASILLNESAGTTGGALCATFFYLAGNPQAYTNLVSKIRTTFQSISEIGLGPKLDSCTYLCAYVEEGLRPSVSSLVQPFGMMLVKPEQRSWASISLPA